MHSNVRFEEKLRCSLATELGRYQTVRSEWCPARPLLDGGCIEADIAAGSVWGADSHFACMLA